MRGCEVVYHAAGLNVFCLRDPSLLFEVNLQGSRNVVRAAAEAGVRRVVYTSSAAALGEAHGTVGSETSPHRGSFLSSYERSKFEAERAVLTTARETETEVVCVNPASVQGPGRATGSTRLLLDYLNGRLKAIVDSTISLVDIADCTEGHLLAEVRGQPGERYVLSGATVTVREGIQLLARLTGINARVRALPPPAATAAAVAVEAVARLRGKTPRSAVTSCGPPCTATPTTDRGPRLQPEAVANPHVDARQALEQLDALPDGDRRTAEHVPLTGLPACLRENVALGAVGDVDEADRRVDDDLQPPVQIVEQQPRGARRPPRALNGGRIDATRPRSRVSRAAAMTARSASNFERS